MGRRMRLSGLLGLWLLLGSCHAVRQDDARGEATAREPTARVEQEDGPRAAAPGPLRGRVRPAVHAR